HCPRSIIVKDGVIPGALGVVARWEKVWDNSGSSSTRDLALWRGIPANDNYVVIGGIFSMNPGHGSPDGVQTDGIVAIHRDFVSRKPPTCCGPTEEVVRRGTPARESQR
ncbi:hypothetical protein B0H17DRAFT_1288221, partial [Mycena rosella]